MISEYEKKDISSILHVINSAALKYKGVIPNDCWHEPYMLEQELINELDDGVRMFGYKEDNVLAGVMGIQDVENVTLIRHAYTLPNFQRTGIGKSLLWYLFKINRSSRLYVGTWRDATWAVKFYLKYGFVLHERKETVQLLKKYWKVPLKQIENSVVLEKEINLS